MLAAIEKETDGRRLRALSPKAILRTKEAYGLYAAGNSLRKVGEKLGISGEWVRKLLVKGARDKIIPAHQSARTWGRK